MEPGREGGASSCEGALPDMVLPKGPFEKLMFWRFWVIFLWQSFSTESARYTKLIWCVAALTMKLGSPNRVVEAGY